MKTVNVTNDKIQDTKFYTYLYYLINDRIICQNIEEDTKEHSGKSDTSSATEYLNKFQKTIVQM